MRALAKEMFGELSPWGRFWLWIGVATLTAAAAMSFDFGWQVSAKHALFLGCLSIITAFAPEAAYRMWSEGRKGVALAIAMICAPLFAIELYSHAGYTAGLRGLNITEARVQNARYDGAQEAAADDKANLAMWREQLGKLQAEHAWAATVSADGLRASLASATKAIDLEAGRGGCKARCLALMKSKADLEARIAIAERSSDLTKRIEATQRILDKKREVASVVEHKSSAVAHQNEFISKAVAMAGGSLKPTQFVEEAAQQSVSVGMAVAGTFLPAFALFIAGLFRIGGTSRNEEPVTGPHRDAMEIVKSPTVIRERTTLLTDRRVAEAIASATAQIRGRHLAAA